MYQDLNELRPITLEKFFEVITPRPSFVTFCLYMTMILLSPLYQKLTKPLDSIRPIVIAYNFVCSFLSAYTFIAFFYYGVIKSPTLYHMDHIEGLESAFYMYYITKNIELFDTVFMILRHKRRQISFLHVFHHSTMVLLGDWSTSFSPWPAVSPYLGLNSFIHIILYFYYGLTALRPGTRPQWKQSLTNLQLTQFVLVLAFAGYGYIYHRFCIYAFLYPLLLLGLFSNFYYLAYMKPRKGEQSKHLSNGHAANGIANGKHD